MKNIENLTDCAELIQIQNTEAAEARLLNCLEQSAGTIRARWGTRPNSPIKTNRQGAARSFQLIYSIDVESH